MDQKKGKISASLLFWALLVALGLGYGFHRYGWYGPVSLHSWRQADGASFARCYYEDGMDFFSPGVHNLQSGSGKTVAEFPLMYYLAAVMYQFFGPEPIVFRLLNFLALALGLFTLFRLLLRQLGSWAPALLLPFLLLGFPVLAFYGFNFMPNTPALGFLLLAAGAFFRYQRSGQAGHYYLMCLLALLGALIKISMLIPFLALAGTIFLEKILPRKSEGFRSPAWGPFLASSLLVAALVGGWYQWASYSNHQHGSFILLTGLKPIWDMAAEDIRFTFQILFREEHHYWEIIVWKYTLWLFMGLWALSLLAFRKIPRPAYLFLILLSLGSVSFLLIFFYQLYIHGYYWLDVLALPVYVFALSLWLLKQSFPRILHHLAFHLAFLAFVLLNIHYCYGKMQFFYSEEYVGDLNPGFLKQEALQDFYRRHGISFDSTHVNVAPDMTPNLNLYYLNLRGWPWRMDHDFRDANVVWQANNGVDYFVVTDTAYFHKEGLERTFSCPRLVFDSCIYFIDIRGLREGKQ